VLVSSYIALVEALSTLSKFDNVGNRGE